MPLKYFLSHLSPRLLLRRLRLAFVHSLEEDWRQSGRFQKFAHSPHDFIGRVFKAALCPRRGRGACLLILASGVPLRRAHRMFCFSLRNSCLHTVRGDFEPLRAALHRVPPHESSTDATGRQV